MASVSLWHPPMGWNTPCPYSTCATIVKSDGHLKGDMPRYFDWNEKARRTFGSLNQRLRSWSTVSQGRNSGSARSMSAATMERGPGNGRCRMGRKTSNLARFCSMKPGTFSASRGEMRETSAWRRSMSGVASKLPPSSNWRRYIGSKRLSSTSSSRERPQASKISLRTSG